MAAAGEILDSITDAIPNSYNERVRKFSVNDAYRTVSWVFSAINLIGDSTSGIEFFFSRKDANGKLVRLEDVKEPAVYCFYPPLWPEIPTISEMIKMHVIDMGLYGEAFMRVVKKGKFPVEINVIHPPSISPITSADGKKLVAWKVKTTTPGGQTIEENVPAEQIIQWKYTNPYSRFRGLAPLTSARLAIEQDLNMSIWNAGFFQNGIRNPIALMLKQTFNDRQRKDYMERLKANFGGFVKGQLPLLVEGGVGVQVLQNTMKDLDFIQGKDATREEITSIFGTPPALVGIYRYAATYSVKEQIKMFYRNTLRPKMLYYRDVFQQTVLDIYFPGVICDWEWDSIEEFRKDPAEEAAVQSSLATTAKTYFDMGLTLAHISLILKRPELDPAAIGELDPKPVEIPEPEVPKSITPPRHSHSRTHEVIYTGKAFLKDYAKSAADLPVRLAVQKLSQFSSAFFGQMQAGISKSKSKFNKDFWVKQWEAAPSAIGKAFEDGVSSAYDDFGLDKPDQMEDSLLEHSKACTALVHEYGITAIDGVIKLLAKSKPQEAPEEAALMIKQIMEKLPAEKLAHRAYNRGRYEAFALLGVDELKWCCGRNDGHEHLHGITAKLGEKFKVVDMCYPKSTKENSCGCTVYPVSRKKPKELVKIRA